MIAADQVVVVWREDSDHDVGVTLRPGHTTPLTYSAAGKAIAAFLPEKNGKSFWRKTISFFTENRLTLIV